MPKGVYERIAGAIRVHHPPELVERVRREYEGGKTIREVAEAIGRGYKFVFKLMDRHGIQKRRPVRRGGSLPHLWQDTATYSGYHHRVEFARGKPQKCDECGKDTPGRYEWANLTGDYANPDDYKRMCPKCHRAFDKGRR